MDKLYSRAARQALAMIFAIFVSFAILFGTFNYKSFFFIFVSLLLLMAFLFAATYNFKWKDIDTIRVVIGMFIIIMEIIIFVFSCIFYRDGADLIFMFFFLPPIGAMVFMGIQRGFIYTIVSIVLIIFVIVINFLFPNYLTIDFVPKLYFQINIISGISSVVLFCFFAYWLGKIEKERKSILLNSSLEQYIAERHTDKKEISINKSKSKDVDFSALYARIIDHFAKNKPYLNPNYNIASLALDLDTNTTYISNALHLCGNISFTSFININRINVVKEKLDNNEDKRYTIVHIFTSSGFNNQTTFNAVFKSIIGITPSEYIKRKKMTQIN